MKRILLTVDFSYQVYRACAANPTLSKASNDLFTGGLYGFLLTFAKAVDETRATDVMVTLDSKPYLRSLAYPDYKMLRKDNADNELADLYAVAAPQVRELCKLMGVPMWGLPGFEADDLTGYLVKHHRGRYHRIYAMSNDSDLFQLCKFPQFAVYNDHIRNVVDAALLLKKHGLTPDDYMHMTALTGTHNDIAGIYNVGPVRAIKALRDPALMRKYRAEHAHIIDRNLELIRLPHPEMPASLSIPKRERRANVRALYRWLGSFDIDVTAKMVNAFEQIDKHPL